MLGRNEEGSGCGEEEVESVVVEPVAGGGDGDHAAVADGLVAGVVAGDGKEALFAPEEQGGRGDVAEDFDGFGDVVAVGREGAGVVVEFPDQAAVGIPVRAVEGEMARDVVGEARVDLFHARDGGLQAGVAVRAAIFEVADVGDPAAGALGGGAVHVVILREAEALDGDELLDAVGVEAGVVQDDAAAEGVADEADGEIVDDVEQGGEIEDVLGDGVSGAGSPGGVAVSAEIEGVDVIVAAEVVGDPIPIAGVVEGAVNEDERGFVVGAVVPELEFEAIGVEEVGDGFHGEENNIDL